MYKTLITSVVLYRCDSRTLTKTDEGKLSIFEREILKKMNGPSCVSGVWRIKCNDELYSLYKEPRIVKIINIARLKWLGQVVMMEDRRIMYLAGR
jgi:hypothetical protein